MKNINKICAPKTVDFNVNGMCNLDCPWCWGPLHDKKIEKISIKKWKCVAEKLKKYGTSSIIISGGEPLLKKGLLGLVKFLKEELSFRLTLSTNAILLQDRGLEMIPYLDDIGIPLDGSSPEMSEIMRRGSFHSFFKVLDNIRFIQHQFPKIDLTVRTVVSRKNTQDVHLIGDTLIQNGVNPSKIRWKLYQINPIGVRRHETLTGDWLIMEEEFSQIIQNIQFYHPQFTNIFAQTISRGNGRYMHINPDGRVKVIVQQGELSQEKWIGDLRLQSLEDILLLSKKYLASNDEHG